jgi:hypothetical protein
LFDMQFLLPFFDGITYAAKALWEHLQRVKKA